MRSQDKPPGDAPPSDTDSEDDGSEEVRRDRFITQPGELVELEPVEAEGSGDEQQ